VGAGPEGSLKTAPERGPAGGPKTVVSPTKSLKMIF
jgi:hypothetical protein